MAPNVSQMAQNRSKWLQMALYRFNWDQIIPKGFNLLQMAQNESKWPRIGSELFQMSPNGTRFVKICLNWSKYGRIGPNGSKFVQFFQKGLNGSKWDNLVLIGPNGSLGVQNRCPNLLWTLSDGL